MSMAVLAENHNLAEDASESSSNQRQVLKIATPSKHRVVTPQSTLNPHLQLRIRLIQEGFSEVDIDRSLEEMWEQDLRYDDFNAVASFIRSRDVVKGSSHTLHPTEEETKTASTAESTTTSKGENQSDGGELNVVKCDKTEDAIDSMGYSVDSDAIQVIRQRKSPAQPLNMSSKLDLVADYENLADSAFALSEWVAKAADRDEVCILFFSYIFIRVWIYFSASWDNVIGLFWSLSKYSFSALYTSNFRSLRFYVTQLFHTTYAYCDPPPSF